jgi:uncharacterized membrane protein YkvI
VAAVMITNRPAHGLPGGGCSCPLLYVCYWKSIGAGGGGVEGREASQFILQNGWASCLIYDVVLIAAVMLLAMAALLRFLSLQCAGCIAGDGCC